jgi:DNA-directed RNA polymerase specialized sigma24 family protein
MEIARHKTRQRELREARALLRRVQRGDRRAFELLYSAYEGRVYRFCHRLTGNDQTAAALVSLTFARALADLPEAGLDTLDVPAYLLATARSLASERNGDPSAAHGQWAGEVAAANQRLSPQERAVLALRDLEGRPDDEIAQALGVDEQAVPGLVGTARLRLHTELRLPQIGAPCAGRLPALSAYADDTLPAEGRDELARHVTGCANCRAALFALREAVLRYRTLPVPEPPGDLGSRITTALGAIGLPARSAAAEPVAGGGRQTAVAVAMGALALVGVGVTIAAARDDHGEAKPAPAPVSPQPQAQPSAPAPGLAVAIGAVSVPVRASHRPPPTLHHHRAGTRRRAHAPAHRARPSVAQQLGLGKSFAPEGPPIVTVPPASASPPTPPLTSPKPRPQRKIPVEIAPPVAPSNAQAASDAPPEPPPAPEPPPPAQTTST